RLRLELRRIGGRDLAPHRGSASPIRSGPHTDPVEPGPDRRSALERRPLSMDDEEDLLARVLEIARRNPETSEDPPDESYMSLEQLLRGWDLNRFSSWHPRVSGGVHLGL